MIVGIGNDIIKIERMQRLFDRRQQHFVERIFTESEIAEAARRHNQLEYYAGRWAAKEALSKALGCGIGKYCSWRDICILNGESGRPVMTLSGNGAAQARNLNASAIHVSISHEREYACATVILEAEDQK
ncbi:MAG: holo-ACP synthase [Victivallales bacterium]|nr:holo-ACP synthase [Victivallales bacterium]